MIWKNERNPKGRPAVTRPLSPSAQVANGQPASWPPSLSAPLGITQLTN